MLNSLRTLNLKLLGGIGATLTSPTLIDSDDEDHDGDHDEGLARDPGHMQEPRGGAWRGIQEASISGDEMGWCSRPYEGACRSATIRATPIDEHP